MKIQNSPFHISHNKSFSANNISQPKKNPPTSEIKPSKPEKSNFWDWFRGLVNPFQNLPIISGIYSSINSEDSNSDRDLVQNSLGGFMYGGPIGAIAGFGNWLFNKIFDKTPSELALDVTGISKFWKEQDSDTEVANTKQKEKKTEEASMRILSDRNQQAWWKTSQNNRIENVKKNKIATQQALRINDGLPKSNIISDISKKYDFEGQQKVVNLAEKFDLKPRTLQKIPNLQITDKKSKYNNVDNKKVKYENIKNDHKYDDINFKYPTWKPDGMEIKKKFNDQINKNLSQRKYLDLENDVKPIINMKL